MSYFHSKNGIEYDLLLEALRTKVPLATKKHYPNVECIIDGTLPKELQKYLPIFGLDDSEKAEHYALNSGGRGIILSNGKKHFRFKGNDLDSSITKSVAKARNNVINDINLTARDMQDVEFDTNSLKNGGFFVPPLHGSKPFSFFTKESVENEKIASQIIGDEFDKKGFFRPYTFECSITYPKIMWRREQCSTLVFSIPTTGSDVRFEEIFRTAYIRLKFASQKELEDRSEMLASFFERLTTWHGFVASVMSENFLHPTETSNQNQNFVICNVSDSEVGMSRVDHTSTVIDKTRQLNGVMKNHAFFADTACVILHAIELAKRKYVVDEDRYTGYFDRAYKWCGEFRISEIPGMKHYISSLENAFIRGFEKKDPVPIPEKELYEILESLVEIEFDNERQERVTRNQERLIRQMAGKLKTNI